MKGTGLVSMALTGTQRLFTHNCPDGVKDRSGGNCSHARLLRKRAPVVAARSARGLALHNVAAVPKGRGGAGSRRAKDGQHRRRSGHGKMRAAGII